MNKKRVVVIGNGMVGHKLCEKLVEHDHAKQYQVVTFCEEPRPAYNRMNLTKYFETRNADALAMAPAGWYAENGVQLLLGQRAVKLDRRRKVVVSSDGSEVPYDIAVLATGSAPFVPPVPGMDKMGVFVYRTIEDLEAIVAYAARCRRAAVLGGGLLGLEAAKAVRDLALNSYVVEFAPRLMPRQLDQAGAALLTRKIEELGVKVMTGCNTTRVLGDDTVTGIRFADGERLDVDMVVVSAGIRPRDDLARDAGMRVGERGGVVIDDQMRTSDPDVYAVGECCVHRGMVYGLVAPGYDMAEVLARNLCGERRVFTGADMSTKLKLLGVDVASFGDPLAKTERSIVYEDLVKGVYKKLVLSEDGTRLLGGSLVGDASEYGQLLHLCKTASPLPKTPEDLILGARGGREFQMELPDEMQVCSCNNVSKGDICNAISTQSLGSVSDVKRCTKAGSGCGGCMPLVTDIFNAQLKKAGKVVKAILCEHLQFTRQELYQLIRVKRYTTFEQVLSAHGSGSGCEHCKPTVASILASVVNELVVNHDYLQDTNDRFLANIQRQGLYSVVPRVPGGEITADQLIALGQVAKKYNLYSKITGGQRVDLFGAHVGDLPDIWRELGAAGFESGHAYGKSLRTVKSCVGSTWCRYGVQDSVGMAIRLENRYKGIRSPHKLKSAVSGCVRECAEAQSKDFALIATEKGYNVYVCGNGGAKPRHADLLVADVSEQDAITYLDRFIMYYIRTADKLMRTSIWLEKLEGGIEHLRDVILKDSLRICEQLEAEMQHLIRTYQCEWKAVVDSPALQAKFRHFANTEQADSSVEFVDERGSLRPSDWSKVDIQAPRIQLPVVQTSWVQVGKVGDFPQNAGMAVQYGTAQIAVFNFTARGEWFAVQNECPHRKDMVLARGIIGDEKGIPKVACPLHKKTFSLQDGSCLSGEDYHLARFPVRVQHGFVYVELPPVEQAQRLLAPTRLVRAQSAGQAACPPAQQPQVVPAE
jgi:nitrite reductase (NADH) large subunit